MKNILYLFVFLSTLIFAATTSSTSTVADVAGQLTTLATAESTVMPTDTNAKIIADNQAQKFVEESAKNSVKIQDYENTRIQNTIANKGETNQSIYTQYLTSGLQKNGVDGLFGIDIINNAKDTVVPVSISKDYLLGTGDFVSIKIWSDIYVGNEKETGTGTNQILPVEISKTGTIFIPNIGSFYANNKSIITLQNEIIAEGKKKLKYFNAEITLEKVREINIFVIGEVNKPGQILTTPYNNILNVLNKANGVTNKASIRNIKIIREGKEITVDLYAYLLGSKNIDELKLKDGDTLLIPVVKDLIVIEGEVNRPGTYELGTEKDYFSLINLAGGLGKLAEKELIQGYFVQNGKIVIESVKLENIIKPNVFRIDVNKIDNENRNDVYLLGAVVNPGVYSFEKGITFIDLLKKSGGVTKESTESFATIIRGKENKVVINFDIQKENPKLELGDEIYIYNYKDINKGAYANIQGAVVATGNYEVYEGTRVLNLLYSARGLNESLNPYMNRADLYRIDENGRLKVFKIDLNKLLAGDENENILLKRNDILKVYTYDEIIKYDDIYIYGEVREPGKYRYYENMTIEDLVFYGKGLKNKADNNIIVSRNDDINKKTIEFVVDIERNPDFKILEGDLVFVRKKADWIDNKIVKIEGFVKFPGTYQINAGETMTSLVTRAGGFIDKAFPEGTQFNRGEDKKKISNFEYNTSTQNFTRDIELADGDTIFVPQKPTTVRVEGEVYSPSYVVYDKKMDNYKDYISAAGGYKESAYKKKVFVIKANGKTIDNPKNTKIESGDIVFVPVDTREKKGFEKAMDAFKGTLEIVSTIALIVVLF